LRCKSCGVENPEGSVFCVRCGNQLSAPPIVQYPQTTESKTPVSLIVILIAMVIIVLVILPAVLYILVLGIGGGGGPEMPLIAMSSSSTETEWVFTVSAIVGNVQTNDVYVLATDHDGSIVIPTIQLALASGTEGFSYVPTTSSVVIMLGDEFHLSKSWYGTGSSITLFNAGSTYIYGSATVI